MDALLDSRYEKTYRRRLRHLVLQHQDITSRGATKLAQFISYHAPSAEKIKSCSHKKPKRKWFGGSKEKREQNDHRACHVTSAIDVDQNYQFVLDLRMNPIGNRGKSQLKSAVDRARSHGWKFVVIGGGEVENGKNKMLKGFGVEFWLNKRKDMSTPEWTYPPIVAGSETLGWLYEKLHHAGATRELQ